MVDYLGPLSFALSQIVVSALHAWHLESNLDNFIVDQLHLHVPKSPLIFGLLRRNAAIIHVPPESVIQETVCQTNFYSNENISSTFAPKQYFDLNEHWKTSCDLTDLHLMAVTSLSNAIMSLSEETVGGMSHKQGWSNLMTLHCALIPGKFSSTFRTLVKQKCFFIVCLQVRKVTLVLAFYYYSLNFEMF